MLSWVVNWMMFVFLIFVLGCFLISVQPVSLGVWFVFIILYGCFMLSWLGYSWYALVLLIVYVGGLMVMFGYMSAINPNVSFSYSLSLLAGWLFLILIWFWLFGMGILFFETGVKNDWMFLVGNVMLFSSSWVVYWMVGSILFYMLLIVVYICFSLSGGALRSF